MPLHNFDFASNSSKSALYEQLNALLTASLEDEADWLANLANASSLLYLALSDINWAGFYLFKNNELILGPFQGKPACVHIKIGKGVCGTAAQTRKLQLVPDVHQFPGHIACDDASRSEIVIPLISQERLLGVMDIDSPIPGRFDEEDAAGLRKFALILEQATTWPEYFI